MTAYHWLGGAFSLLVAFVLLVAGLAALRRRRRLKSQPLDGWLSDAMVRQIIETGTLTDGQVPEEALNLEQIAREEERFWTETWDEPDRYWE